MKHAVASTAPATRAPSAVSPTRAKQRRHHVPRPVLTELPAEGLFRIEQFIPSIIAVGQSTWWAMVRVGRAPAGQKLSPKVHVWSAAELRAYIASLT